MEQLKRFLPRIVPTAVALALFFVVAALYFAPQFGGDKLAAHDTLQYEGMAQEIKQMRAETGDDPQWTGAMFGGMPAYLIDVSYPTQLVVQSVGRIKNVIDTPAAFLFFAMTAFWLMLLIVGIDPWVAIVPSIAYGLSTYFLLIIGAGHVTKMWAMVWAPLMMGGAWMALRGNIWYGGALTALAASLEIGANHPQITYYFLMAMAAFWLSEGFFALKEKRLPDFVRRTSILALAGIVALLSNLAPLWYTAQHSPETIRGGSELAATSAEASNSGLDLEYATAWSYGKAESWNLLIPDFAGRDSGTAFSSDGAVAAVANGLGLNGFAEQLPAYWGGQPYTAGPTYLGAAAIFLALLGLILTRGRNRWWIAAIMVVMLLLGWGRNLMGFTEFFFDYLPGYNKFRTVSTTLVVIQWAVPLLGALALGELLRTELSNRQQLKALGWAAGITGGLCLGMILLGGSLFSFGEAEGATLMGDYLRQIFAANNLQQYIDRGMDVEWGELFGAAMAEERLAMMQADAWRSLVMIALAAGVVWLFIARRIGKKSLAAALAMVMLIDLVPVDMRFLSHEDFVSPARRRITASAADKAIMQDTDPAYRVLNLTVSPFNDASTSYFHRSVGGYHGAKLARYQDLIDHYLNQADGDVLDMLNTRYVIIKGESGAPEARLRETAYGAAWWVESVAYAPTAQSEIELLGQVDLRTTAVVAGKDSDRITTPTADTSLNTIELTDYRPNHLTYRYSAATEGVVLFSEIFYDKGWTAYIDGVEAPYFRADYVLRAMQLPAGDHTVEWRFRAPQWGLISGITLAASLVVLLAAAAALFVAWKGRKK
ncbi:MAG: YfhO family protein [Rikenellaceae bacterium]|nr:YfhO family protein [Rikenellaceae bacterium]